MGKVSFKAKQGVYLTYKGYTYKAPQVFGEFIDNSIQSHESNKNALLMSDPNYKLRVDINFEWELDNEDNVVKAKKIVISDNAAGMTATQFADAFDLADMDVVRTGMNEFGVGMKAASAWLGNKWRMESTSITDGITRTLDVDLTYICKNNIEELDSKETMDSSRSHGTTIIISELWKENVIKKDNVEELAKSIASIYRYFLRTKEIQIFVGEENKPEEAHMLTFEDYAILKAPSYLDPDGEDFTWKCTVSQQDSKGHGISGFIALLKDTKDENRGVVIMRNHRVVMGFDPKDRTVGKVFYSQVGSKKYRRVFGELEITGFKVAFGKNQVNDPDLLEALCKMAAGTLKIKGANLLTQADKYSGRTKKVAPKVTPVNPPSQPTTPTNPPSTPVTPVTPPSTPVTPPATPVAPSDPSLLSTGKFKFGGNDFSIQVKSGNESSELFWNDLSKIGEKTLICKVNTTHPFFSVYGQPTKQVLAMVKALSIAKYKATVDSNNSASAMMNEFNSIINNQEA